LCDWSWLSEKRWLEKGSWCRGGVAQWRRSWDRSWKVEKIEGTVQCQMLTSVFPRMLLKTTDYLDHFARFKRKENVEAVERLLSAHKELAKFERAQLGTSIKELQIFKGPILETMTRKVYANGSRWYRFSMLRHGRRGQDPDPQSHR
jgi:hypothetical protein